MIDFPTAATLIAAAGAIVLTAATYVCARLSRGPAKKRHRAQHHCAAKFGRREAGHLDIAQHAMQRGHRLIGRNVEAGRQRIAVADIVQVLVSRNPLRQLVGDRFDARFACVALADAGGQFLERDVHNGVQPASGEQVALLVVARAEPPRHLLEAQLLELDKNIARVTTKESRSAMPCRFSSAVQRVTRWRQGWPLLKFIAISR